MRRTVFDPTVSLQQMAFSYAPRPASLHGVRVGLVENTKYNSDVLLLKIAERLQQRYGTSMVHLERKKSSGHSVSEAAMAHFQQQADLVIAGVGD